MNFRIISGWDNNKEISDKHAHKIINVIDNITNVDNLERKKYGSDIYIQLEYFGITEKLNEIYKQI